MYICLAMKFDDQKQENLIRWEDLVSDELLHEEDIQSKESQDYKIQLALDK